MCDFLLVAFILVFSTTFIAIAVSVAIKDEAKKIAEERRKK